MGEKSSWVLDIETGHWRASKPLPQPLPSPESREGGSVWTGTEFLRWGGQFGPWPDLVSRSDGLAYNPSTDTWTEVPAAPMASQEVALIGMVGDEVMIWGMDPLNLFGEFGSAAAYNPKTKTWRTLRRLQFVPFKEFGLITAQRRPRALVYGVENSQIRAHLATYEPATDTWTEAAGSVALLEDSRVVGDERGVWLLTHDSGSDPANVRFGRLDAQGWTELDAPPVDRAQGKCMLFLTVVGSDLVAARCRSGGLAGAFDGSLWRSLGTLPVHRHRWGRVLVMIDLDHLNGGGREVIRYDPA